MENKINKSLGDCNLSLSKPSISFIPRVVIVDDHPIIRAMIKIILQKENIEVVAEADNGVDAVQLARQHTPDLIILDLSLPRLDGMEALSRIVALKLPTKVLVVTSFSPIYYAVRCMRAGAAGFVSKSNDVSEVINAISVIVSGYTFFPYLATESVREKDNFTISDIDLINKLTNRELLVLQQLSLGWSNKEIGKAMLLSNKTVSTYKARLIEKLNLKSIVHLADFAKRNNLLC